MYGGNYNMNGFNFSSPPYYNDIRQQNPLQNQIRPPTSGSVIPGRSIADPAEIKPVEVPMDGSVSYFPTNDGQYIYAKCWSSDGTIVTAKYIRSNDPPPTSEPVVTNNDILERLERIEKLVTPKKVKEG